MNTKDNKAKQRAVDSLLNFETVSYHSIIATIIPTIADKTAQLNLNLSINVCSSIYTIVTV